MDITWLYRIKEWFETKFEREIQIAYDILRIYKQNRRGAGYNKYNRNYRFVKCPECGQGRVVLKNEHLVDENGVPIIKNKRRVERIICNSCKRGYN